jgi:hypothetical protein
VAYVRGAKAGKARSTAGTFEIVDVLVVGVETRHSPPSSAAPAATAEHPATGRAETDAVAAQAVSGTPFVGDVLAAKPIGVLLAGSALLWRALRSRRCRRRYQGEAEEEAASRSRRQHCSHTQSPCKV